MDWTVNIDCYSRLHIKMPWWLVKINKTPKKKKKILGYLQGSCVSPRDLLWQLQQPEITVYSASTARNIGRRGREEENSERQCHAQPCPFSRQVKLTRVLSALSSLPKKEHMLSTRGLGVCSSFFLRCVVWRFEILVTFPEWNESWCGSTFMMKF